MNSKTYRHTDVKTVDLSRLAADRQGRSLVVGLDIGKDFHFAVLRWDDRRFERPWRVRNTADLPVLLGKLDLLRQNYNLVVAMEPTGTYADALRQLLHDAKFAVHRVSPKKAHDYAEIFDGVPSQHDGKDAAIVAELAALGKSSLWPFCEPCENQELVYQVCKLDLARQRWSACLGRLEGLLSRHWPESLQLLKLSSATLLNCLAEYGGPAALSKDSFALSKLLAWGGKAVQPKAEKLLQSAKETLGVRQHAADARWLSECAAEALRERQTMRVCGKMMGKLAANNEVLQRQAEAVGMTTACVLWVELGNPSDYHCGEAYRKAMGLNLTEHSSGKWNGPLHISKRGSRAVRRWLYFAALRLVRKTGGNVRRWYEAKKARDGDEAKRALVAVMRKLALALYQVGKGQVFEKGKLFASLKE